MKRLLENSTATQESVWAAFHESDRQRKENERILKDAMLDLKTSIAETNKALEKSIEETKQSIAETTKALEQSLAETNKALEKSIEETKQSLAETRKIVAETSESVKETNRLVGGIANSNGDVAETYFVNSFLKSPQFAGQKYDSFIPNLTKNATQLNLKAQYDLVLYNCTSVAIIEIKYNARKGDIQQALKKAKTFKQLFPEYANYNLYLGLAGLHVEPAAENEARQQGIAIIKQVGDNMVVYDEHLKVF